MEISLCMIVRDEEDSLGRCLDSASKFVDEIIIVDTGSVDKTKSIALEHGAKVFDFPWIDDFAAARNYSFAAGTKEWLLWLDADDVVPEDSIQKMLELKKNYDPEISCYFMHYAMGFDKEGKPSLVYERERLVKRSAAPLWQGAVHETITFIGKRARTDITIEHRKIKAGDRDRNLKIYEKSIASEKKLSARDQFYYSRELYFHGRYEEASDGFRKFLSSPSGWIENRISASVDLASCRKLVGDRQGQFNALLDCLHFAPLRSEVLCEIAAWWMDENEYDKAKGWYLAALAQEPDLNSGAFISMDCYGYIPAIQLSVCFFKLGDVQKAYEYNEKAGSFKPLDNAYNSNRRFYAQRGYGEMPVEETEAETVKEPENDKEEEDNSKAKEA